MAGTCASSRGIIAGHSAVIPDRAHGVVTPRLLPEILTLCIAITAKSAEAGNLRRPHKIAIVVSQMDDRWGLLVELD
jgi:hypothetical protein